MPNVSSIKLALRVSLRRLVVVAGILSGACAGAADSEEAGTLTSELCSKTTLTASTTGPVPIGTVIQLSANSSTCAAGETPEFRFYIRREGATTKYTEVRGFSTAEQFALDTTGLLPGKYTALVYARAVGRTATKDSSASLALLVGPTCAAVALSATPAAPQLPGVPIALAASATCSEGAAAEHRILMRPPGAASYVEIAGWRSSPFPWATSQLPAGPYTLLVYSRAVGNSSPDEASQSLSYRLGSVCTQLQGALSPAQAAAPGTSVSISALATCTDSGTPDYQFSYRPTGSSAWQVIAPWAPASAISWNTQGLAPGPYQVALSARANDYPGPAQVSKTLTYTLGGICSAVKLAVSPKSPQPLGASLNLTGTATCIGEPIEYRFLYKESLAANYTEIVPWSGSATATFNTQAAIAGLQTLRVEARVKDSGTVPAVAATAAYQLGDVCTSVSVAATPGSPQPAGTLVGLVAAASCVNGGVPQYRFSYHPAGGGWVTFRDWGGATASLGSLGLVEGAYVLRVEARGQGHLGAPESTRSINYAFGAACPPGYASNGANSCVDVNECATNNGGCHALTTCSNSPGSFGCGPCPAGYSGDGAEGCVDVNECATNNGGCHALTTCSNLEGGYLCSPCPTGYSGSGGTSCTDIDECATNNGGCHPLGSCFNTPGGFACGPCPAGYSGNGSEGCTDVDECASNNGGCDWRTTCSNTPGSRSCSPCPAGFSGSGAAGCNDINECASNNGDCDPLSTCSNLDGSFSCGPCPAGYQGSGAAGCTDIDECTINHGGCDALTSCSNSAGSSSCGPCPPGYGGSGASGCVAPNPCSPNPCQNGGTCATAGPSYTCACSDGYGGNACEIAPVSVLAAGDVADCNLTGDTATGLLLGANAGSILPLGDLAYPNGSTANFTSCFDPVWGPYKARMKPVPGNHEYNTTGAAPYYAYFGEAAGDPTKGYYSYDLGTWHLVALNSNCTKVSCSAGSAQEAWLRQDLAAHPNVCTLAYFHHPRFSSGDEHGNDTTISPIWKALSEYGVEIALSGHDHDYERFAPQTDGAVASPSGVVQFVVGTGGSALRPFGTIQANSVSRNSTVHGLLKLTLAAGAYSWTFLPIAGKAFTDSGTTTCH